MSKKTKRTIVIAAASVLLIAAAVIIFLVVKANSAGYRSISIAEIFGKVIAQNDGKTYEAYKNMRLADGYELTTDPDSYTRMLLDDDKYVKLEQDSHAIFEALGDAKRHVTTIRLDKGALTSEITKPLTESESYVVNTPNAVLAVRGTMFRVEVKQKANGDYYSDVYTFGGTVVSRRIMPDGTLVDEEIEIPSGYKATVKMDEVITVYLEEKIEEEEDNIDPIDIDKVNDATLVDVYNASRHGHDVFSGAQELWNEIQKRDIDLSQYKSIYDGNEIPAIDENSSEASSPESDLNNSSESPDFSDNSVSGSSDSSSSSSTVSSSESGVSREPRPVSSSASSSETHEPVVEPVIDPDTSASDELSESSGEASDSHPASSSSRPASTSSKPETPMVEHTHTLITTTSEPTCTKSGSKTVKCKVCGETMSKETLPPKGHTSVTETVKPATCTDEGEEIDRCSVCGGQLGKRTLPALGHTERSTENDGVRTVTCSVCGQILRQINIASGVEYPVALDATNFPDEAFRQYVSENFDTDGDGVLSLGECEAVETVNVKGTSSKDGGITSLDGIESFGKLKTLNCNYNSGLTELDVSKSAELNYLDCSNTSITLLDVSQNTALEAITCNNTSLTSLDVSENTALIRLLCQNTKISALEVSNNTALEALWCYNTQIASLDVSNNPEVYSFRADGNRHSIHVEDGVFDFKSIDGFDISRIVYGTLTGATMDANGVLSGITKGTNITYTYDCKGTGEMDFQGTFTFIPDESSTFYIAPVTIDAANFPDEKFRAYVSTNFDKNRDGKLSQEECDAVTSINVSGTYSTDGGYASLKGVEYFSKLETLDCSSNQELTELDVSKNTALTTLLCNNTQIISLDVSKNTALTTLWCDSTQITSLDVSKNTVLTELGCFYTQITSLDVSNNTALTYLGCYNTQITSLDISKNAALKKLECYNTQIASLDVSKNTVLEQLWCSNTQITSLDVSKNTALIYLFCNNTQIPFIDIGNILYASVSTFNADGCKHPIHVENGTFDLKTIEGFDISKVSNLTGATMDENGVLSGITEGTNITYTYDCKGPGESFFRVEFTLVPDESSTFAPETPEGVAINAENFPDEKFRDYVSTNFDTDGNGVLSAEERNSVTKINVSGDTSTDGGITSLVGVENFTELKALHCNFNSGLTELDISYNMELQILSCSNIQITILDISNTTALTKLYCNKTQITSLDVSNNMALETLWCDDTQITALDVSNNSALTHLSCDNSQITSLDVSNNSALKELFCGKTQITELDVSKNAALTDLRCYHTQIASLDVSQNPLLKYLYCLDTQITVLDVSNNMALETLWCDDTPITSLDISNNTALKLLECNNCQLRFIDTSNNPNLTTFIADGNTFTVPDYKMQIDTYSEPEFTMIGFKAYNVYDVEGADYSRESGIFYNFTSDTITYKYDCDGDGVGDTTFTMIRTPESTSISNLDDGDDDTFAPLPPDGDDNTPPPNAPEETDAAPNEDAALPPENIDGLRFLPLGILALMRDRKRNTAFRVKRKAEI